MAVGEDGTVSLAVRLKWMEFRVQNSVLKFIVQVGLVRLQEDSERFNCAES